MPAPRSPVGPFPSGRDPEEYDRLRRRVFWTMPAGIYVVGSRDGDRLNAMTCNWAVQLATAPKLLGVAVEHTAVTHQLISTGRCFALSILARHDRAVVRRFVKPATAVIANGTLNDVPFFTAVTGAPILRSAVAWLDCRLESETPFGSHTLFAGEVVDAGFEQAEDTAVLRMEDTRMSYGG